MSNPFSAIRQSKVSEEIVEQIKILIRDGQLKPGEKLPSERQLAQMLEVGRSSLREAINSLSMMGLVEVKRRKGIYVGSVSAPLIKDPLRQLMEDDYNTFTDLYDIRIDIEVASAAAAAAHRTEERLDIIRKNLLAMKNQNGENFYVTEDDLRFHMTIAEASGNFLRVHIVKELFEMAGDHIDALVQTITAEQENTNAIFNQHTEIFQAIERGDSAAAGKAMLDHLQWVRSQLDNFI